MPATTIDRGAADLAVGFDHVSKVFCGSLKKARDYAMRDIFWPRPDRPSKLRDGEWVVLRDVSFELKAGQTLLILGVSGSGKTALADLVTGRRTPDVGKVVRSGSVGPIGDGKYGQNPFMRLREYLRLMAALQGVEASGLSRRVEEILEWTGLTAHAETTLFDLPKTLMKPVARVGSLLADHDIYVFDNYAPFGDSDLERRMAERFRQIQATRTCVVLSQAPLAPPMVDHALVLHGGEIIYGGEPQSTINIYDRFIDHARVGQKRRGAGSGRGGALHHEPVPPVDEALVLIRDLLGSGGPTWAIDKALDRFTSLEQPLIIGPCLAGTAWEVLFWLPFLKWMRRQLGADPPATAVSRCAVGRWYEGVASSFVDIYDLIPPEQFEACNQERARAGSLKQVEVSPFERELLHKASEQSGISGAEIVHPSLLLGLSAEIWRGRAPLSALLERGVFERLPPSGEHLTLPDDYVAVSFFFTKHFPDAPENRARIADAVQTASARTRVVVLGDHDWLWSDGRLANQGQGVDLVRQVSMPTRHRLVEAEVIGRSRRSLACRRFASIHQAVECLSSTSGPCGRPLTRWEGHGSSRPLSARRRPASSVGGWTMPSRGARSATQAPGGSEASRHENSVLDAPPRRASQLRVNDP
jgi:ABC-type polysaccharide/polyol phosphate transport system ATPase subunit